MLVSVLFTTWYLFLQDLTTTWERMALRAAFRAPLFFSARKTPVPTVPIFAPRRSAFAARSLGVRVDKSHGERAKLTGLWTSKLPQEMVAAMSQGEGDGDIFAAMQTAAKNAKAHAAAKTGSAEQIQNEARKEATRDHDR